MDTKIIRRFASFIFLAAWLLASSGLAVETLRPPAVPLVACDPYFSIWSPADKLTDANTIHWTGKSQRLTSLVRIDGKTFRVMGADPKELPALQQTNVEVLPTRTIYTFEDQGINLTLAFATPALPDDIDLLSRPVTYLTYTFRSIDDKEHRAQIYFEAKGELAVTDGAQPVSGFRVKGNDLETIKMGTVEQPVLAKKGDDLRIDWGYLFVSAPKSETLSAVFGSDWKLFDKFGPNFSSSVSFGTPVPGGLASTAFMFDLGDKVGAKPVSRFLMLAYDDEFSIQYMKKNLRPYWRRNGNDAAALLKKSAKEYESLTKRCRDFDAELMADLRSSGGEKYARLAALAYRQCFAAGKFVADDNGQPLQFCKENHSNGCIGTSDVFYPMSPQFLLFGPSLAKSFLVPFMDYAGSERWKFPFAPHDLGTYPHANGQVYGGGERTEENQMPVEESGNLLILMGAIAQMEGNADFAGRYWKQLEQWAEYLRAKGFDPENQLCTDDFAGHLAHNVNLSAKAICGLGSFAKLCAMRGDNVAAQEYFKVAREFAQRWVKESNDGDHSRLAFDRPGTWSQKYNLIWDRILELNLFPAEVARKEMEFYKKTQNEFGLPLDNRKDYTKLDWITWTATLTQDRADFETLIDPVYAFLNATQNRSPMTDWYETKTAKKVGFTARPVVGGVFAKMLYDKTVWKKWASRDRTKASNWAPIPQFPKITVIVPAADTGAAKWHYSTTQPGTDWMKENYDVSSWKEGWSGFGTRDTPGAVIGTLWETADIWMRREVELPTDKLKNVQLWIHHDEDAEVFINGIQAAKLSGFSTSYDALAIRPAAVAALKPGKNIIAIHCHQTGGGQYIDSGLVVVE